MSIIAFDSHKYYTFARVEDENGQNVQECRIEHQRGNIVAFLRRQQPGSAVAIETIDNWYWIVDEIEKAGMRPDTNHYLKWAFSEAGNSVALNSKRLPDRHVSQLYNRVRHRRNHGKAVGAVARHLAEATYWMLTKGEAYRERGLLEVSSTGA